MIDFREPEIEDKAWVESCFRASGNQGCEYSFSTLFLWSGTYRQQVAAMEGYVLERVQGSRGAGYLFPAGSGPLSPVLTALEEDARDRGEPCRFFCVTPEQARLLETLRPGQYRLEPDRDGWDYLYDVDRLADLPGKKLHGKRNHIRRFQDACPNCPGQYRLEPDRDGWDYLYDVDRLADLPGKKLHGKRNHIRRFQDACPNWQTEEITMDNLADCAAMDLEWNRLYRTENGDAEREARTRLDERHAMSRAFAFYDRLGLFGLLLRSQGRVVAFTMGSLINGETVDVHFEKAYSDIQGAYPIINREFARLLLRSQGRVVAFTMGSLINGETVDVHFEKAYSDIQGAYPIINREFARWVRTHHPDVRWLNREDDMGLEGLRRSKLSYYPDRMVEKSLAVQV